MNLVRHSHRSGKLKPCVVGIVRGKRLVRTVYDRAAERRRVRYDHDTLNDIQHAMPAGVVAREIEDRSDRDVDRKLVGAGQRWHGVHCACDDIVVSRECGFVDGHAAGDVGGDFIRGQRTVPKRRLVDPASPFVRVEAPSKTERIGDDVRSRCGRTRHGIVTRYQFGADAVDVYLECCTVPYVHHAMPTTGKRIGSVRRIYVAVYARAPQV